MSLGINNDDLVLDCRLLQALQVVWGSLFSCVQLVLMVSQLKSRATSLMDGGCMDLSIQLRGSFHLYANFLAR